MRKRLFISLFIFWTLFFLLGKMLFAATCGEASWGELFVALWHGLPLDLSTICYIMAVPLVVLYVSTVWRKMPLRAILMPWHCVSVLLAAGAVLLDIALYPFWQFKLNATILNYVESPGEAAASVSTGFVVWRTLLFIVISALALWRLWSVTPARLQRTSAFHLLHAPVVIALMFLVIRGGVGEGTMNVGNCYHSQRMFMNHVAVNPLFSFIASMNRSDATGSMFRLMPERECRQTFDSLYAKEGARRAPQVVRRQRPNVLVILWEGGGASFFHPMGGLLGVMPNLEEMSCEGVLFDNMRCTSWRTDRGMVSALSGWFAYPSLTLMRMPVICDRLPCLGRTFSREGYDTFFLYGGDISYTHTSGYLTAGGYNTLISDKDFTLAERRTEKWGVTDSITFERLYDEVVSRSEGDRPWHGGMLTLSSHEPFKVPYSKYADEVLNAMSYTDHCLGRFMRRLKARREVWDNLLVVILPDHGYAYNDMARTDPGFFRVPMVWTGGAVGRPHMEDALMSQSDMPATLLGALGIDHSDYPYSRDALDSAYVNQWAYSATSEFVVLEDTAGRTIYNLQTNTAEDTDTLRLHRLKAVLQGSHTVLDSKK